MKTLLTHRKPIVALFAIIFALTFHSVRNAQAYTHIYVDAVSGTNAPTGRGAASSPYQSITYALLISARNNLSDPWHVHIRPGTYNADPTKGNAREIFPLKLRQEMIFEGTTTAQECIIDGQHTGAATVPILSGADTEGVTIRNLTIQNSLRTKDVGGIVLHDLTGTKETPSMIEGCIVHNNKGGGVWSNMPLILTGNTFSSNDGHAVLTSKSTAATKNTFTTNKNGIHISGDVTGNISENTFRNNNIGLNVSGLLEGIITRNVFTDHFRGVSVGYFSGDVTHNTFTRNVNGCRSSNFFNGDLTYNTFTGNKSEGFRALTFTGNITHNEFTDNSFHGVFVRRTFVGDITHNKFTRNYSGFTIDHMAGKVTHNIFDSNSASRNSGGFFLGTSTNTVEVFNNIFFNNTTKSGGNSIATGHATHFINNLFMISDELSEGVSSAHTIWVSSPECRFHNNIFSGVRTAIYTEGAFDLPITHNLFHNVKVDFVEQAGNNLGNDLLFWELVAVNATDNLEGDPQLVDPVTTRDFHLQAASPAINAGTNAFAPADDLDGVTRPVGRIVDIGPYEYGGTPTVTRLDPTATTPEPESEVESEPESEPPRLAADVNGDGQVDVLDLVTVAAAFGETGETPADVNGDGVVDIRDLVAVAAAFGGTTVGAPSASILSRDREFAPTKTEVEQWLAGAQRLRLTDAISQRGIHFLEQLLLVLTPKETALLANYPNPFNPETWIPYQLVEPAEVTLRIYGIDGTLVRTLSLGHQATGIYQSRNRAAYWGGKNNLGEPVASGVYFYTLTAGDFTATRKMLIRK